MLRNFTRTGFGLAWMLAGALVLGKEPALEMNEVQIRELVKTLGAESFLSREQAGEMLLRQGSRSLGALSEGARNPDFEVARRSRQLMLEIRDAENQLRLKNFVTHADEKFKLPGWDRFSRIAGADGQCREFYARLFKHDSILIEDSEADSRIGKEILSSKAQGLHQTLYSNLTDKTPAIDITDIGTVLFLATNPGIKLPQETTYNITNLLYQQTSRTVLSENNDSHPYRKLIVAWMMQQSDANIISQHLYLAQNLNLREGVGLARRSIENKEMPVYTKAVAMTIIGKMGGPDDARLLENHLEDSALVGNFQLADQQKGATQVRDVALAMLVQMEKKSHKDYGFSFARSNLTMHFNPYTMGFTSEEARSSAFLKWHKEKK